MATFSWSFRVLVKDAALTHEIEKTTNKRANGMITLFMWKPSFSVVTTIDNGNPRRVPRKDATDLDGSFNPWTHGGSNPNYSKLLHLSQRCFLKSSENFFLRLLKKGQTQGSRNPEE
jgi:hypothetical protein